LREPPSTCAAVALGDLAAVVVPGLVFDHRGNRLGWGAGHYDRTLPLCSRALRVGLAFDAQVIERLEPAAHDVPVHWIATEVALYPGAPPGRGTSP
jgi:5-formyltetrahydrofolate cyclo-ligase